MNNRSRLLQRLRSSYVAVIGIGMIASALTACSSILPPRKVTEFRNPDVPGTQFQTIAVIAGDETGPGIRMSATMREDLNKNGWKGVRRSGRWTNENEAVGAICQMTDEKVDGVLIVFYNQLVLRACAVDTTAFRIVSSGGEMGLPQMAQRLFAYLRTGPGATGTER